MITIKPISAMEKVFPNKAPVNIETKNTVFSFYYVDLSFAL